MQDLINEDNLLRLDIDGGERYLTFAKKQLRQMKDLMEQRGIVTDNRIIDTGDAEIFFQSAPGGDYIRITGSSKKTDIVLIFIRDTSLEPDGYEYELLYDTSGDKNGKDYRALLFRLDDTTDTVELTPDGMMGDGLTIFDTGLTLNVQSGDGVYAAELPSIFVYNDTIDYAEFTKTTWSSSLIVLYQQRVVGSYYITNWVKTDDGYTEDKTQLMRMPASRHPYTLGGDGRITACMFRNRQERLGSGVMYRELSLTPEDEFYLLWKNELAYKKKPDDNDYIIGQLIGSDYITGTPWQTGYNWMTYQVIDVFDKDNALVKIESNVIPKGGNIQWPFSVDLEVTARWYLDRTPPVFYSTTETWQYKGEASIFDVLCIRLERLMVGGLEIERAQYEESRYDSGPFVWIPGAVPPMTLVRHTGDAHGGYGDGATAAKGSISGHDKFNAELKVETFLNQATGRENVRWQPISIGERHEGKRQGYRDIHVTAFDNGSGADYFIVMYRKSYVDFLDSSDTPTVNDGTIAAAVVVRIDNPTVTSFHIAYKTKTGDLAKIDISGGDIRAASCQINNGYMAYTYCTFKNGAFEFRTIGMIDVETGTKYEWNTDDMDERLNDFHHVHHAAIGIL